MEYASLLAQVLNVRVEYLLLKDDFRTEHEMFENGLSGLHDVYSNIVNLIKLHGYDIKKSIFLRATILLSKFTPTMQ